MTERSIIIRTASPLIGAEIEAKRSGFRLENLVPGHVDERAALDCPQQRCRHWPDVLHPQDHAAGWPVVVNFI